MLAYDGERPLGRTSPRPSKAGRSSPWPSASLSHIHITDALLKSPDHGATLDLSHKGLTDVGESGVEELATIGREDLAEGESSVQRVTLGHNHLTTLPMAFSLLTRLRYLNLRSNNFVVFPDVLTVMSGLEVLDMGRNKIKHLPSQPGSLIHLKVLSLSRNKLSRLPDYLVQFRNLNILQIDHNPIEWPPRDILSPAGGLEGPQAMKNWIASVQRWIEANASLLEGRKFSSESTASTSTIAEVTDTHFRFPDHHHDFDAGVTPHARSFSIDSDISINSAINQRQAELRLSRQSPTSERPPYLHIDPVTPVTPSSTYSTTASPTHSPDRYLPTPEESIASSNSNEEDAAQAYLLEAQQHARNASYAGGLRRPTRPPLLSKKSLPDLRTAQVPFGFAKREMPVHEHVAPSLPVVEETVISSPVSQRQDSGFSEGTQGTFPHQPPRMGRGCVYEPMSSSPTSLERPVPAMDVERNSYFKRLSTLPSSTISKTIPDSLLKVVDAARGILFAVSQVYQTLQHYTVFAIDERLSSVLLKVLDPASTYMAQLISALDRFDSTSRRTVPHPTICRAVVDSCKDTVAVFGKAVAVLALQLKVLARHDDVRYTRQMLLVLYGATAEISNAWRQMTPHLEPVQPFIRDHRPTRAKHHPTGRGGSIPASPDGVPFPTGPSSSFNPLMRSHLPQEKVFVNRRHAGSFSYRDVELGKKLPSYVEAPPLPPGHSDPSSPGPRTTPRPMAPLVLSSSHSDSPTITAVPWQWPASSSSSSSSSVTDAYFGSIRPRDTHSRQTSQASLLLSSSVSSPVPPLPPSSKSALDIPASLTTLVDKQALNAMRSAIEAAPTVWGMVDAIVNDMQDDKSELTEILERARYVTDRLRDDIRAVEEKGLTADKRGLRDNAHVFVKTVVDLSTIVKTHGGNAISQSVQANMANMVQLTNSTEEFLQLLHVSSFSPSTAARPYLPASLTPGLPSASSTQTQFHHQNFPPQQQDQEAASPGGSSAGMAGIGAVGMKLGASLSRSRSAQPAVAVGRLAPAPPLVPRSAQPNSQTFKIPGYLPQAPGVLS